MRLKKRNRDSLLINFRKIFFLSYFILPPLVLDQVSKLFADKYFLSVCNKFGVFGLATGGFPIYVAVLFLVAYSICIEKRKFALIGLSFIFAGGLSNILDRLLFGCVRDFIRIASFPTFNLADASLTIGVILVILGMLRNKND